MLNSAFVAALFGAVATIALADPGPPAAARAHQVAAARHLLHHLEHGAPAELEAAEQALARIHPFVEDGFTTDRVVLFPVHQEHLFLRRVVRYLQREAGLAAGRVDGGDGQDQPMFTALLRYLCRDDYRLLAAHLREVARATEPFFPDSPAATEGDTTVMLMIRTLRPERWDIRAQMATRFLGLRAGERVADIGCGSGFYTAQFSRLVGPQGRVYAVDRDRRHLELLDENQDLLPHPNVVTSISTSTENRLPDDSVDCVFLSNILYDVESYAAADKARFYASVRRVLRPGGRFVACDHPDTFGGLPREETSARLEDAGFRVEAVLDIGGLLCLRSSEPSGLSGGNPPPSSSARRDAAPSRSGASSAIDLGDRG